MKNRYIKRMFYKCGLSVMLVTLSVTSCKKINEFNPVAVSTTNLTKFACWSAYQTNCYTCLWGSLIVQPFCIANDVGTDLWTFPYGTVNSYQDIMAYKQFTNSDGIIKNIWDFAWGSVENCNQTIQTAGALTDGAANAAAVKTLVAETKVLRAYYYSVLVSNFGAIPLSLTDDPVKTLAPVRTPIPQIYAAIVADLQAAATDLGTTPYQNNAARVTKKAALGLLARVYAQGAGEGLSENGVSYWARAKAVADDLIANQGTYGATLYGDFAQVFASANNRNNAECLFTAYGLNPYDPSY